MLEEVYDEKFLIYDKEDPPFFLRKLAPTQSTEILPNNPSPKALPSHMYNKWYHRPSAGRSSLASDKLKPAPSKVDVIRDSGSTQANFTDDFFAKLPQKFSAAFERKPTYKICINFARGNCTKGKKCRFLHRIPQQRDAALFSMSGFCEFDVFGRKKFATPKRDGFGIGTHNCRTLRIERIAFSKYKFAKDLLLDLRTAFAVYGPLEKISLLKKSSGLDCKVCFVHRVSAEFAKVAMERQSLNNEEILLLKWNNSD